MGRRGPKFSFPIPGWKSAGDKHEDERVPTPPVPSFSEWPSHGDDGLLPSKAQRLLGTSGLPLRPSSRAQSRPQSPGYMTITVSEASFGSDRTDRTSSVAVGDGRVVAQKRSVVVPRPSSNLLGPMYQGHDGPSPSNASSVGPQLRSYASNSTIHSHYDAQNAPLFISQQTSASAVRDMALRKGRPRIIAEDESHPWAGNEELKKRNRKSKPTRLDLSKLFPKPQAGLGAERSATLLSPNKLVHSPSTSSTMSEYFPRRVDQSTSNPANLLRTHAKSSENLAEHRAQPSSPKRLHRRDMYDNAKIHVRRPPRGIQHWFDGLGEESDEDYGESETPQRPSKPKLSHLAPVTNSSLGRVGLVCSESSRKVASRPPYEHRSVQKDANRQVYSDHLNSPSQFSTQSQGSTRTKDSAFSRTNLQDSSVLSISSSESDDDVNEPGHRNTIQGNGADLPPLSAGTQEVVFGKAQALDMRIHRPKRQPSVSRSSLRSISTNAATIEVMYSPEPYSLVQGYPRYGGSRRSSHVRQPSVILEDEVRPQTSAHDRPMSSSASAHSTKTAQSEPRPRAERQKLMAVTEEEEALLEMMRRKRAAMAQQSFSEGYKTAVREEQLEVSQKTPPKAAKDPAPRVSAFLSMDSPLNTPIGLASVGTSRKSDSESASPLLRPASRQTRSRQVSQNSVIKTTVVRHPSPYGSLAGADACAESVEPPTDSSYRLTAPEFSPLSLEPFPSPGRPSSAASIASRTATSQASPLPSPITPALRNGETDLQVRVAGSEPSCNGDDEFPEASNGFIEASAADVKRTATPAGGVHAHQRRRTASSGAEVPFEPEAQFPVPPSSGTRSTSQASESVPQPQATLDPQDGLRGSATDTNSASRKSSSRASSLTRQVRSRHSSVMSTRTSSPASGLVGRRSSRTPTLSRGNSVNRDSTAASTIGPRCSVSEDVLAAWGSLGGWRNYETGRIV